MSGVRAAVTERPGVISLRNRIVSHRMPLDQAGEAMDLAQADAAMQVVVAPHGVTA
jgi:hypothetical protein